MLRKIATRRKRRIVERGGFDVDFDFDRRLFVVREGDGPSIAVPLGLAGQVFRQMARKSKELPLTSRFASYSLGAMLGALDYFARLREKGKRRKNA